MSNLITLLMLFVSQVRAQEYDDRPAHFGFKFGALVKSLATTSLGGNQTSDMDIGFSAGILYEFPLAGKLYLQPELLYDQKGGSSSGTYDGNAFNNYNVVSIDTRQDLKYVNMPVLFELRSPGRGMYGISFGPEFGYLLSARQIANIDTTTRITSLNSSLKKYDIALDLGINYRIYRGLGFDFMYSYGLQNILKPGSNFMNLSSGNQEPKLKTRAFMIDLFFKY